MGDVSQRVPVSRPLIESQSTSSDVPLSYVGSRIDETVLQQYQPGNPEQGHGSEATATLVRTVAALAREAASL